MKQAGQNACGGLKVITDKMAFYLCQFANFGNHNLTTAAGIIFEINCLEKKCKCQLDTNL